MPSRTGKELLFEQRPHLRDEWDYEKNAGIDPERLTAGSGKDVWWRCSSGHEWKTRVWCRGKQGTGCSQCNSDVLVRDNPLTQDKELSTQLDDPRYLASDLNRGSHISVWWKCGKGHRWQARVTSRTSVNRAGCPYCSGRRPIRGETDLATLRPDLASQWDDEDIAPTEVTVASSRRVRWKCDRGHQFITSVNGRSTSRTKGSGCPYCSKGRYAKAMAGVNDLATLWPEIAKELYSTEITPQELREFSNKKLDWKCSEGHIYAAQVSARVLGSGCGSCSTARTSKIEGRLRDLVSKQDYLSETVLDANHRLPVKWGKNKSMSVDIYCEWRGLPVVVEYDGAFWHDRTISLKRDASKTDALLAHNYIVVRVREGSLPLLEMEHPNLLQLNVPYARADGNLEVAIGEIERWLNSKI